MFYKHSPHDGLPRTQAKTFCKWLNTKLEARGLPHMASLSTDLSDGVRLIELMEIMGDTSLGRYYKNPKMRVQRAENVNKALDFIKSRGVVLTNVGAEGVWSWKRGRDKTQKSLTISRFFTFTLNRADIVDGNLKLILGMIWTLILRFTIADIRCVPYRSVRMRIMLISLLLLLNPQ